MMARRVAVAWNWIEMSVALHSARSIEKKGSSFSTNHSRQKKTLTLGIASHLRIYQSPYRPLFSSLL